MENLEVTCLVSTGIQAPHSLASALQTPEKKRQIQQHFFHQGVTPEFHYSSQRNYRVLHNYRDAVQSSRKVNDYKTEISQSRANVCTPITEKTTRGSLR